MEQRFTFGQLSHLKGLSLIWALSVWSSKSSADLKDFKHKKKTRIELNATKRNESVMMLLMMQ